MDNRTFEELLEQVQKPAQYLGNEWNVVKKDLSGVDVKLALCFPELYEIGMSHLGFKLIYHLLNERGDIACERVFAPGMDMDRLLRERKLPLFSLESKLPLRDFDIVGFSLAYEMTFTNVLNILDLAGIPLKSSERNSGSPLIIAGGCASFNPEPMSEFMDLFVIGEAEEVIFELVDKYKEFRNKVDRGKLLKILSGIKGIYVPSLYEVNYNPDGTIKHFRPVEESRPLPGGLGKSAPPFIGKRFIKDLDTAFYPASQIVPYAKIVHDRISLEIMRGCPNGCRFCEARVIGHYKRQRSLSRILELSDRTQRLTGYEELSLLSLSSGDHSEIEELISRLVDKFRSKGVRVSLPSLHIDRALKKFPSVLARLGITGLTFAPEAGSERLRSIIKKDIDIGHLQDAVAELSRAGWKRAKLYFMMGLPGEETEDLNAVTDLIYKLKKVNLTVSVSAFIPKPHTPFQWSRMQSIEALKNKFFFIKDSIKSRRIKFDFHDPNLSFLEGILSRGDRRISGAIQSAYKNGAVFDSWTEFFSFERWLDALKESKVDPHFYLYRQRPYEEILPWDHIITGVSREYLIKESKVACSIAARTPY